MPPPPPPSQPSGPYGAPPPNYQAYGSNVPGSGKTDGKLIAAAVLMFIQTAFLAGIGLIFVAFVNSDDTEDLVVVFDGLEDVLTVIGAVFVVLGIVSLVAGIGCVKGRQWGRILTIVIQALFLVLTVIGIAGGDGNGSSFVSVAWCATSMGLAIAGKPKN
jgi:hypothetical protein